MRRKFGVATGLALLLTASLIATAQARILRCTVEDAREVVEGTLEPTATSRISIGAEMLFDESENSLTMPGSVRWHLDRLQDGSAENDLIAIRVFKGPSSVSVMTFRIRPWEADLPFLFVFGAEIQSGRCKPF